MAADPEARALAEAVGRLFAALEAAPDDDRHWLRFARLLPRITLPANDVTRRALLRALHHPLIPPAEIARPVARTLCRDPAISRLIDLARSNDLEGAELDAACATLAADPLVLALLRSAVVPWPPMETLLTALRRSLLMRWDSEGGLGDGAELSFLAALATNAFLTDYAWFVTDEEAVALERLSGRIEQALGLNEPNTHEIALLAACRPLRGLAVAPAIAARAWPDPIADLVRLQFIEPLEERALRDAIPRIGSIEDPTSREVREQYEEHPYPRWLRAPRAQEAVALPDYLRSLGAEVPADAGFATPAVLIAGCGTGQQALHAASFYRDAKILAVDLSVSSLAYAMRRTREAGVSGIEYAQADLLELAKLGRRFHVVDSLGVLHHLADPLAGWRVLVDLLHPGGLMHIALYSELARRAVAQARDDIAAQGLRPVATDIRRCRRDILALPDDHPMAALHRFRDLYNLNECRDLLFHVREHRFTLPRIAQALDTLGLRFLGFDPPPREGDYRRMFPADPDMRSLEHWHEFELRYPDAFAGMYRLRLQKA